MPDTEQLLIESTDRELVAPASARPGPTTFTSVTSAEGSGWVGLARLEPGVDWPTFRGHLRDTVSDDQDRIVKGSAALAGCATLLGGAVVHPGMPGAFTVDLRPGPHVLFDYPDAAGAEHPRYQPVEVAGPAAGRAPEASGTIRAVRAAGSPRFDVFGTPTAGEPIAFENAMPGHQPVEAVLFAISDRVGDRDMAAYFAGFQDGSGDWPPDPPFELATGCGFLPLSPGQRTVNVLPAPAGRYVVVNWLKDIADGVRLAKRGQFRILEVTGRSS